MSISISQFWLPIFVVFTNKSDYNHVVVVNRTKPYKPLQKFSDFNKKYVFGFTIPFCRDFTQFLCKFHTNFLQCVDALKTTGHQTPLRRQKCLKFAATGEQVLEGNKELPF